MTEPNTQSPSAPTTEPPASPAPSPPAWPPDIAPDDMICRSCQYELRGLAVSKPDGLVRCPECSLFSKVSQREQQEFPPRHEAIITDVYEPGRALTAVGVCFALAGFAYPIMPFAAMALGAFALERSRGKRGLGAIIAAFIVLAALHILFPMAQALLSR